MKTRLLTLGYMGLLALLPLLAVYLLGAVLWSVLDARPQQCVILTLVMTAVIFAEVVLARCWRVEKELYAFQALLLGLRFPVKNGGSWREAGVERVLKAMRGIPGLEDKADEQTAERLFAWRRKLALHGAAAGKDR